MGRLKVLIVGGGIGGLTALLALRQRGIEAQLFEQAAAFRQVSAGLQISSNATCILIRLGLGEALKRVAARIQTAAIIAAGTTASGSITRRSGRSGGAFGSPYYPAHRAELLDVLLSGVGNRESG